MGIGAPARLNPRGDLSVDKPKARWREVDYLYSCSSGLHEASRESRSVQHTAVKDIDDAPAPLWGQFDGRVHLRSNLEVEVDDPREMLVLREMLSTTLQRAESLKEGEILEGFTAHMA